MTKQSRKNDRTNYNRMLCAFMAAKASRLKEVSSGISYYNEKDREFLLHLPLVTAKKIWYELSSYIFSSNSRGGLSSGYCPFCLYTINSSVSLCLFCAYAKNKHGICGTDGSDYGAFRILFESKGIGRSGLPERI